MFGAPFFYGIRNSFVAQAENLLHKPEQYIIPVKYIPEKYARKKHESG